MTPIFGGTPSYKRKRGIYRALKRGDPSVTSRYQHELMMLDQIRMLNQMMYGHLAEECKFMGLIRSSEDAENNDPNLRKEKP